MNQVSTQLKTSQAVSLLIVIATFLMALSARVMANVAINVPPPSLSARSYIVVDHTTGYVIAEKNADEKVEPASITKIMTVYAAGHALATDLIQLDDEVLISEKAWRTGGSKMFIEVGKRVSVDALLDGIIIQSGNDASVALAEHISGSEATFASVMNAHAERLGMEHSSFANATGLPDPDTYVTARDIVKLSSALVRDFPELYARFSEREFTFNDIRQPNRNRLLARDKSVDGIKTGFTDRAGYCLVSSAKREDMRLVSAVMGTSSDSERTEQSSTLLNYGFRFFETRHLYGSDDVITQARVWGGEAETLKVVPATAITLTIPRGRYDDLSAKAKINEPLKAPLTRGQPVGEVTLGLDDKVLATVPLVAQSDLAEGSLFSRLYDELMLMFE